MLELRSVSYRYAGYAAQVLRDVSLTLGNGEIVGLVGGNESGKSTLCLVASGLAPASIGGRLTGDVLIDGISVAGRPVHDLASRVAIGFQNPATQRSGIGATVFEEVALGPMNLGLSVAATLRQTRDALRRLHIEYLADRDPGRLSGGQAQLVAIASLLAMRPPHIVLDEPTAQLDPEGTTLVGQALRDVAASGASLLIVEHKTDLLDGLCNRVAVLEAGRLVVDGPTEDVLRDERLEGWGVEAPARVRLERALAARGFAVPHPAVPTSAVPSSAVPVPGQRPDALP
jgi:energy-coupling factor transporter ATP-binding protein EcfA2